MKTISRYIMTLALLLTAVTGAWAQSTLNVVEFELPADWATDNSPVTAADLPGFKAVTVDEAKAWTGAPAEGSAMFIYGFDGDKIEYIVFNNGEVNLPPFPMAIPKDQIYKQTDKFFYPSDAITVEWNASTKTGNFAMPGSDVVLTPIYAKAATFATTGTEPDVKTLLPEAAEGVIAGTDAPLIKEGTGIVAFAGTSTEVTQGTLMYAVTPATVTEAPAFDAANKWSADVPTAKTVADGGIDVLVWYYIQGADAPEGEAATLDNTFSDTEPACLTVQVLSNKFDIQLNAANANTIEAGKATVTVAGAAATVTDGKLQGVKMGSEVKLEAKPGYKFRKVEVKKKEATPLDNTSTAWADGAFAVPEGGMTYSRVINVSGNVTLTLPAGTTLTINGGINLECGATLTIEGEGAMQVNGTAGYDVDMAGSNHGAKAGHGTDAIKGCETSKLIVNGGTVTAAGGNGGIVYTTEQSANFCDGGNGGAGISVALTVNGGTLTAIGGTGGTHANSWNGKDGTNGQGINSTFTAGTGISFSDSDNGTDWTANTGTSSTKQYVKAE